jgi:hypothetical protein
MTLTVRTDHRVEEQLVSYALRTNQTKSDVVKQALSEFLEKHDVEKPTPWELLEPLLAEIEHDYNTNPDHVKLPSDLSINRKKYLDEYYAERHARRRGPVDRHAKSGR